MKKILITGASGLVGSHLLEELENGDFEIFVISQSDKEFPSSVTKIQLDLSAEWSIGQLPEKMDIIVHLAQSENFRLFPEKVEDVFYVNTLSTLKLADYARMSGVTNFVYASSAGIYGTTENEKFSEDKEIVYKPELGFYLGTKYCSEVILQNYTKLFNVITLRFFFVYGKGQKRGMLMPRLVDSILAHKEIQLAGQDGLVINPVNVKDAVKAVMSSLEMKKSEVFNIAGAEVVNLRQICETIGSIVGVYPKFSINAKTADKINIIGDITKMKSILYSPIKSIKEGILDLLPDNS